MKILFISNDISIFTAGSSVYKRFAMIASQVEEVHVISRAAFGTKESNEGKLFLHPVCLPKGLHTGVMTSRARSLIIEHKIEVVSAQDPFEYGQIALNAIQKTNARLHVQIHTDLFSPQFLRGAFIPSFLNRVRLGIAKKVLKNAHGIRVVSKRIKDSLDALVPALSAPVEIIPISVSKIVPEKKVLPERSFSFTFLTVSRLEEEKRIEDILHALAFVRRSYSQAGLVIIGSGRKEKALKEMARNLHLQGSVLFLGQRDDAWSLMQDAHVYVQASAYEGYGRTLIEAALAHIPIITTDVGVVGELFTPNEDVFVSPVGDVEKIAFHMKTMIEDQRIRHVLAMGARFKAEKALLSEEETIKKIVDDLASVTK